MGWQILNNLKFYDDLIARRMADPIAQKNTDRWNGKVEKVIKGHNWITKNQKGRNNMKSPNIH